MLDHVSSELNQRYLSRAGFFWKCVRDARFAEWQKAARNAAWNNLTWDRNTLGISDAGREAAQKLGFVPSEVFAHLAVLAAKPEMLDYYRLLACLPNKGLAQIKAANKAKDPPMLCHLLNEFLSSLLAFTAHATRQSLLNSIFAEAGAEWQGTWVNSIGLQASQTLENIVATFAEQHNLLDVSATTKLADELNRLVLKSGTIIRFCSEPDVECRNCKGELICVIEIKGSADKAGAQTRLGETKKSFTKAKLENARCVTIFLPSILTPAVERQLKTERDIDKVFNLLAIFKDELERKRFLTELFKFILRENVG